MRLRSLWDANYPFLSFVLLIDITFATMALLTGMDAAKPATNWIISVTFSCLLFSIALHSYFHLRRARREKLILVTLVFDGATAAKIEEIQRFFEIDAEAASARGLHWLYQVMVWSREGKELVIHDPQSGVDRTLSWTAKDHDDLDRVDA